MNETLRRFGFGGPIFFDGDGGSGGGSGSGDGGGDGGGSGGDGDKGGGDGKTFTQADVDRLTGSARVEARRAAERKLADDLGCTVEEAKSKLDAIHEADTARLSDVEKREREADERTKTAEEAEARAALAERNAAVMVALISEGVEFERNDDGTLKGKGARLLQLVNADLDPKADPAAVATAVAAVKADTPELFGKSTSAEGGGEGNGTGGDGTPPPSGDLGADGKPKTPATTTELERGKERAKKVSEAEQPFDVNSLRV